MPAIEAAKRQEEARLRRLAPRKRAVEDASRSLSRLLSAAFITQFETALGANWPPSFCEGYGGALRPRPALLRVCPWACNACCNDALAEIEAARVVLEAKLPIALAVTRRAGVVYRTTGEFTEPAAKLLRALPGQKEPALPRSLATIATAAGVGTDKARKLAPEMRRLGLIARDSDGCWRRLVAKP